LKELNTMQAKNITKVRKLAALTVFGTVGATLLAALVLPRELLGVLPIVGLTLPLLATAGLEAAAERRIGHDALSA
jgi:hypothetical protein